MGLLLTSHSDWAVDPFRRGGRVFQQDLRRPCLHSRMHSVPMSTFKLYKLHRVLEAVSSLLMDSRGALQ